MNVLAKRARERPLSSAPNSHLDASERPVSDVNPATDRELAYNCNGSFCAGRTVSYREDCCDRSWNLPAHDPLPSSNLRVPGGVGEFEGLAGCVAAAPIEADLAVKRGRPKPRAAALRTQSALVHP